MNSKAKDKVNKQVYRRFPNLNGAKPKVQKQNKSSSAKNNITYLLTYKGSAKLAGSKSMPIIIRVVSTEDGKILKLSSSR